MGDTPDEQADETTLSDRVLDLFVFLPTGLAVTVADELPRLAERGRQRFGVQVNSARAVGQLVVKAGHKELTKRSTGLRRHTEASPAPGAAGSHAPTPRTTNRPPRLRTIPYPPEHTAPEAAATPPADATPAPAPTPAEAHIPDVASLAIPGFDTLSASQVVQRLDGLTRSELVAVRAYETPTRGRRTILSRVDQLMDERS